MSGFMWVIRFLVSAFIVQGAWLLVNNFQLTEVINPYLQSYDWVKIAIWPILAFLGLPILYYPMGRLGPKAMLGLYWLFRLTMCAASSFTMLYVALAMMDPAFRLEEKIATIPQFFVMTGTVASLTALLLFTFIPVTGRKQKSMQVPPSPLPMQPVPPPMLPPDSGTLEISSSKEPIYNERAPTT